MLLKAEDVPPNPLFCPNPCCWPKPAFCPPPNTNSFMLGPLGSAGFCCIEAGAKGFFVPVDCVARAFASKAGVEPGRRIDAPCGLNDLAGD